MSLTDNHLKQKAVAQANDGRKKDEPASFSITFTLSPFLDFCVGTSLLLLSALPLVYVMRGWSS